jgi:salicylate hydroxylase
LDLGAESIERYGYPYLIVHRADLHGALARAVERLRPGCIHLGHKIRAFSQAGGQVHASFDNGTGAQGDVLVGVDGVHSVVRRQLFGADAPVFTGYMAWRGLIEARRLPAHLQRAVGVNWVGLGRQVKSRNLLQ